MLSHVSAALHLPARLPLQTRPTNGNLFNWVIIAIVLRRCGSIVVIRILNVALNSRALDTSVRHINKAKVLVLPSQ